jgi:hypothetical protein
MTPDYWETLKVNDNYMIYTSAQHPIKNAWTGEVINEYEDKDGYAIINLKDDDGEWKTRRKHIVIATQWLHNPENLPLVDHFDHNPKNNNIENLQWVSFKDNAQNRGFYRDGTEIEYFDDIPDDAVVIDHYKNYTFTNYFYWDNKLLHFEQFAPDKFKSKFKVIRLIRNNKSYQFNANEGSKQIEISLLTLKQIYNLP